MPEIPTRRRCCLVTYDPSLVPLDLAENEVNVILIITLQRKRIQKILGESANIMKTPKAIHGKKL